MRKASVPTRLPCPGLAAAVRVENQNTNGCGIAWCDLRYPLRRGGKDRGDSANSRVIPDRQNDAAEALRRDQARFALPRLVKQESAIFRRRHEGVDGDARHRSHRAWLARRAGNGIPAFPAPGASEGTRQVSLRLPRAKACRARSCASWNPDSFRALCGSGRVSASATAHPAPTQYDDMSIADAGDPPVLSARGGKKPGAMPSLRAQPASMSDVQSDDELRGRRLALDGRVQSWLAAVRAPPLDGGAHGRRDLTACGIVAQDRWRLACGELAQQAQLRVERDLQRLCRQFQNQRFALARESDAVRNFAAGGAYR